MSSRHFAFDLSSQAGDIQAMKVNSFADMKAAWKRGGRNGGKSRAAKLSKKRLSEIARMGGLARRKKILPKAA